MYGTRDDDNYLEISRQALRRNARTVCDYVGVPVIGVVKCDGYGVTLLEAALAWKSAGATMFAVSRPQDAATLRHAGFREDILLLTPVSDGETLQDMARCNVILPVTSVETARFYCGNGTGTPVRVHVAVDTGMGRFGVRWTDLAQLKAIYALPGLRFEGIFSHFSKSFEKKYRQTRLQLRRFLEVTEALKAAGYPTGLRHIANSCAALRFPETRLDAVRIGSALVGALCAPVPVSLERVGEFKARVADRKSLLPGDTTGYASACRIRHYTTAVIVSIGHEDGFGCINRPDRLRLRDLLAWLRGVLRGYVHRPCVRCNGKELPILGRIGNQYTLFDATGLDIRPGDYVSAEVPLLFPHPRRVFR